MHRCDAYHACMDLHDQHVVVTGAGNGIGRALASRFHADGANVCLVDIDQQQVDSLAAALNTLRTNSAVAVVGDVSSEIGNQQIITSAEAAFGQIDLFFANAGVGLGRDPFSAETDWNTSFDVNVHAHRWAAKYLLPGWLARGHGYFCSTASAAGLLSQIGSAPYSVTKHAAVAFAEWLSITYGDQGIRVSCLCPQGVNTNMLRMGDDAGFGPSSSVVRSAGAVLEPDEVAHIVSASIAAEAFLILPHPEVLTYWQRKTADYPRWLAGMRRLQARIVGP